MKATINKNECKAELYRGNCLDVIKEIPDNSLDSIITDPPYELGFMGKKWDGTGIAYNVELWRECLRVLKPGAHLLAFSGTRTYHRMAVAIEDAGFEIRDMLEWVYASGFPKSLNIGKAYDKKMGNERYKYVDNDFAKRNPNNTGIHTLVTKKNGKTLDGRKKLGKKNIISGVKTKGTSPYEGLGTGLKPAHEPIVMARKPLSEKTIVENVVKWGTGGIDVDGCRVPTGVEKIGTRSTGGFTAKNGIYNGSDKWEVKNSDYDTTQGRFPANILCTDDALNDGVMTEGKDNFKHSAVSIFGSKTKENNYNGCSKSTWGSKSRFFDIDVWAEKHGLLQFPKASKKDRGEGNTHPTVKPSHLMAWLVRLVCREGGLVLDPFLGSGTTGVAALNTNRNFIGIEQDEGYFDIAVKRMEA